MGRFPLSCSICKRAFYSEMAWHSHLVQCSKSKGTTLEGATEGVKECCVVIDGDIPCQSLLGYLSQGGKTIISYFYGYGKNTSVRTVQFEREDMVNQLFQELNGTSHFMIEDKFAHVIRAVEFPMSGTAAAGSESGKEVKFDNWLMKTEEESSSKLWNEFVALCEEVVTPANDCHLVLDLLKGAGKILELLDPSVKLGYFRHSYLNEMLIYTSFPNQPLTKPRVQSKTKDVGRVLENIGMTVLSCDVDKDVVTLFDKKTGIPFQIVFNQIQQPEIVISELLKFLFDFDPRAKALYNLLLFWVREHGIKFGFKQRVGPEEFQDIPEALGLEWLCVFYCCQMGLIPTPRKVLNPPVKGNDVMTIGETRRSGTHTWFRRDRDFVRNWGSTKHKEMAQIGSDQFVWSVLELLRGFLEFYTTTDFTKFGMNTTDGKVIPLKKAMKNKYFKWENERNAIASCYLVCGQNLDQALVERIQLKLETFLKSNSAGCTD